MVTFGNHQQPGPIATLFGEPRPDGYVPPLLTTLDQTRWWAEIFNVPCVAYAARLDDICERYSTVQSRPGME